MGVAVHEARRDQGAGQFEAGKTARRQPLDLRGRADAANAPVLPPEGVALDAGHQGHDPSTAKHTPLEVLLLRCQTGMLHPEGVAFQRGFHMLISREREYLDWAQGGMHSLLACWKQGEVHVVN
jgi:hypothetical protein